ncbi:hypothetical protein [Thiorhodospira sibirica]|uniref:hypothetical protein n=1 Tax=Thiorhodospira sibirica TaxID=154347 RepID=UPI000306C37A|nr:hypothetical protein [Thiorhodospira sibirica]
MIPKAAHLADNGVYFLWNSSFPSELWGFDRSAARALQNLEETLRTSTMRITTAKTKA